jgi:hypothetical protein
MTPSCATDDRGLTERVEDRNQQPAHQYHRGQGDQEMKNDIGFCRGGRSGDLNIDAPGRCAQRLAVAADREEEDHRGGHHRDMRERGTRMRQGRRPSGSVSSFALSVD